MTSFPKTLKDPKTCRVFISSPFGGFEKEREELVRKYFPQLSHLCQSKGIQFVTVDMRWGITEEAATDAQVVNICLREVDRSDIFVGYYGQRYGWHGDKDDMLQKNIENASKRYTWLKAYKDRSVTEMEFLHGHLNKPGAIPAIIAFRDRAYDEEERSKADKAKEVSKAMKYTVENDNAKKLLDTLKEKVVKTKKQCLAIQENYKNPEEGAKFVFEELKKHIENVFLKSQGSISKRDIELTNHSAYMTSRVSIFVGGEENEKALDQALTKGGQNTLIVGPAGSGKAALLSHWLSTLKKKYPKHSVIYHFVGCSTDSASTPDILMRLTEELNHMLGDVDKSKTEKLQEMDDDIKPKSRELSDLFETFEATLAKAAAKHKIVLALDGLGKVQKTSKISKTLFWLPVKFPSNVTVVVTCRNGDKDVVEELTNRGYKTLKVPELNQRFKEQLCTELLKHHSKELSSSQLKKIVNSKQTGSPLYLKTVISELCAFGKFRELGDKIDELIACKSVKELFEKFIRRLEADYILDTKRGNIIEQVLCSIRVSRKGLSEKELMAMHNIPSHEWSPLFFAMQLVIVEMAGLLKFGFTELQDAVDDKYMNDKNTKLKYQKIVANYFHQQMKEQEVSIQLDDASLLRPSEELPWLYHDMKDFKSLQEILGNLSMFGRLFLDQEFELIELWRSTGLNGEQIADIYLTAIQERANAIFKSSGKEKNISTLVMYTLISYLNALTYFMEMASYKTAQEKIVMAEMKIMETASPHLNEAFKKRNMSTIKSKLAYLYTDTGRAEEAAALHKEVLETRQEFINQAKTKVEREAALKGLGNTYHGIAMLNSKLERIPEAIEYYTKAIEVQKQLNNDVELADSLHNLGVMYMKLGKYKEALDFCTKSMKIYEDIYFSNLPPVIGVMIGNIAVCHRNLGQVDEAEKMYKKAIEINERAVGRQHPHVAIGLMNIGTLEINRQNYEKAEEYFRECMDIFEKCETLPCDPDYYRSLEKFVYVLVKLKKAQEAVTSFQKMYAIAQKENYMDTCSGIIYTAVVDLLIAAKQFKLAQEVTLALLKSKQADDKNYIHYDVICRELKQTPKPEYTLDKAMKRNPGSLNVLRYTIDNKYLPQNALQEMIKALDDMDAARKVGTDLYGTAVIWCEEAKKPDMALGVLEHGVKLFPNESNFVCSLAQKYYEKQEWKKAMEHARKMCQLEPNIPNHFMMLGDLAIRTGDMAEAKKVFNDMLVKFSKNEQIVSQARKALDMINKSGK